jgi:hypothetical protein
MQELSWEQWHPGIAVENQFRFLVGRKGRRTLVAGWNARRGGCETFMEETGPRVCICRTLVR